MQLNQSKFLSQSIDFNYKMLVSACKFTTLYILQKYNERQYLLEDPLERQYRVNIDKAISCSCHEGNLGHCIHSLYILVRVYKLPENHPFVFKNMYTEDDLVLLNEAGRNSGLRLKKKVNEDTNNNAEIDKLKHEMASFKPSEYKVQTKDESWKQKKQQKQWPVFDPDTVCPICYDQIENQNPIIDCKHCRNYFHTKCLQVWVSKKKNQDGNSLCPMCRSGFQQTIPQRILEMQKYFVQYHKSHGINCSACGKDILVKLYKCLLCEQVYLCKECYLKWEHKNHDKFIAKQGKRLDWTVCSRSQFSISKLNANLQYMRKFGIKNTDTKQLMGEKYEQFINSYTKKPSLLQHIMNSLMDVEKEVHKTYKKLDFDEKDIVCCMCKKKKIVGMRRLSCKHFIDEKCLKFVLENQVRQCPVDKKFILPGFKGVSIKFQ